MRTRDFAITAEVPLNTDSHAAQILKNASVLSPVADAVQVTENQYGHVHLSPLAAASILMQHGFEPILQLSCLNRNRVALIGDLLAASALGIRNLLLVPGNKVLVDFKPKPKFVIEIGAKDLIATAKKINDDQKLVSSPDFLIGTMVTVHDPEQDWIPGRLVARVDAGATFVQTQLCCDMQILRRYMKRLVSSKIIRKVHLSVGLAVLPSPDAGQRLRNCQSQLIIPDSIVRRLKQAKDAEFEGVTICAEQLQEIADIPGVSGANLMTPGEVETIPAAIQASGLRDDQES